MNEQGKLAAAILAGGASTRFGKDKSLLQIGGRTLVALTAARLAEAGFEPVVIIGPPKEYGIPPGVAVIPDLVIGLGPAGGVLTALEHFQGPVLVVSCDLPELSVELIRRIRETYTPGCPLLGAWSTDGPEPLCSVYHPVLLPELKSRMNERRLALHPFLEKPGAARIEIPRMVNLNRPGDWKG
jgi:molybdopterin-guanine dinucleotide biosynthesis protein A